MISDIPSPQDFELAGQGYLNLAWDSAIGLALDHRMQEEYAGEVDKENSDEYWNSAQRPLAAAVALAVQGAEMLIKAKIAAVSPYLLIAERASDFPSTQGAPIKFSDFKTPDARDLVRIHDAVANTQIPASFIPVLSDLRAKRNVVFHSIDKSMRFAEQDALRAVLLISEALIGPASWIPSRRSYLYSAPILDLGAADSDEYALPTLSREFMYIDEFLSHGERARFLGLEKMRRYSCGRCYHADQSGEYAHDFAQLRPAEPGATSIYCYICDESRKVERIACTKNCGGDVFDVEYDVCLTCINPRA